MFIRNTTVSAFALLLSGGAALAFPATATTDLNVRSGPGTGYAVVDQLQGGDTVEVTSSSGSWYRLASGGWASANYLDAEGSARVSTYVDTYDDGYYYDDYGPVSYYYNDYPAFYDNGFYFYIRDGRRHRVDRSDLREARRDVRREQRDVREARGERNDLRSDRNTSRREVRELRRDGADRSEIRAARGELRGDRQELREGRASLRQERGDLRGARQELREERRGR